MARLGKVRLSLAVLVLTAIAVVSQLYLFLPVADVLAEYFDEDLSAITLLTTYFGFAYAVGFLVWGSLSDRIGRKTVLIVGLTGLATTSLLLAWAPNYTAALALRVIQGFMASAFPPVALALIAESFPPAQRMKGIAWMSTAFLLAALVGQWLGSVLVEGSLLPIMALLATVYAISVLACSTLPGQPPQSRDSTTPTTTQNGKLTAIATNTALWKAYAIALVLLGSFVTLYASLALEFGQKPIVQGVSVATLRLLSIPCMFMPLFIGRFIARFGAQTTAFLAVSLAAVMLFLQALLIDSPLFVVCHLIFVASIAAAVPSVIARVNQVSEPHFRGLAVSLYTFTLFIGASLGASLPAQLGSASTVVMAVALSIAAFINLPRRQSSMVTAP
ncbi:MFS transporter [Saccharospirillum salsuginis]|uniref:MFS transporter n=1 Tax=Saccharospirillum salsuginis TaxID=418750 RepID=A0A918KSB8_9GAMM|nr:MFS transporter [Saccharospirillum salsuginis]GGX71373.1 MFS transporter [Saccharospirillum salsuginis]